MTAANVRQASLAAVSVRLRAGGTPPRKDPACWGGDIPFVKIEDITAAASGHLTQTKEGITQAGIERSATWLVPPRHVLLSMYGSIGAVAINDVPVATNQAIIAIEPDPATIDADYLAHSLRFRAGELEAQNIQTTQRNVNAAIVRAFVIPVPPLDEQHRIVGILSTIRSSEMVTARAIERATDLLTAFKAAFLTDQDRHAEHIRLGDLDCTIATGPFGSQLHARDYVSSGIPVLNPTHLVESGITEGATPYVSTDTAERLERHRLREGDILVPRRGDLARYARIDGRAAGALCGTGCMVIRLRDARINPDYVASYFSSQAAQAYLRGAATGTIMPNINPKILAAMPIPVPPRPVQHAFVRTCDAVHKYRRAAATRRDAVDAVYKAAVRLQMAPAV